MTRNNSNLSGALQAPNSKLSHPALGTSNSVRRLPTPHSALGTAIMRPLQKTIGRENYSMRQQRGVALSLVIALIYLPLIPLRTVAQKSDRDEEMMARIRKEGMDHSQILKTMHMLADVYGPRLTGSPNHKHAAEWALK